jgi:diacylglycerol O-acyltransferase / wax synthase
MSKLNYMDSAFLKLESSRRPFHVAGLMLFKMPDDAPRNYLRSFTKRITGVNGLWPMLNRRLSDPENLDKAEWIEECDYDPRRHVFHYSLPEPGRMEDLMQLVCAAHERAMDRNRPLWEVHVIGGLSGNRFALYCKVHHALIDGVGALRMADAVLTTSPHQRMQLKQAQPKAREHQDRITLARQVRGISSGLLKQYAAVPQLLGLLAHMGEGALRGKKDTMPLPFTAPHTIFNGEVDSARRAVICDLPLNQVRTISRKTGGTINDVLLAVCGGALRDYLIDQDALPRKSLVAGLPVSLKTEGDLDEGNKLSFILCPFFTDEPKPLRRLQRIIKVTKEAKAELAKMSSTASQDFANMMMMPTILLTLSGNATRVNPALNAIFSNVAGSREKLYLEGAELQGMYPLSVVTDGMGINLTVISYANKLCFAVTSCPTEQPGIDSLGKRLRESFRDLKSATDSPAKGKNQGA